ncbi:hypothetical protein Tco_0340165 [Tanacetum coccineum]
MYDSWASRIRLFIKGKKHGRMMLDSIDNGPLVYPNIEENGQTKPKKYSKLTEAQQLQDDYDVQATNIILHGIPPNVLYNLFDKIAFVLSETLYEYYWRFSQLINDMHTIRVTMQQVQVNTKFLNALLSEWSKFVTDVNRERYPDSLAFVANSPTLYNPSQSPQHSGYSMYLPPQQFTPVHAAPIHHQHHHTLVNPQQHSVSPPPFISPSMTQQSQAEFPQLDSSLVVSTIKQSTQNIVYPRNQATIQDGRVIIQQVQGRQNQSYAGTEELLQIQREMLQLVNQEL